MVVSRRFPAGWVRLARLKVGERSQPVRVGMAQAMIGAGLLIHQAPNRKPGTRRGRGGDRRCSVSDQPDRVRRIKLGSATSWRYWSRTASRLTGSRDLLLDQARGLREEGWWQRLGGRTPPTSRTRPRPSTQELRADAGARSPANRGYAREVNVIGRETDPEGIKQRVAARMTRQEVLHRKPTPLRMHAILSEASLRTEVGGPDVLREQLDHLVTLSRLPNVTIQVLRFEAGATWLSAVASPCSLSNWTTHRWATSRPLPANCSWSRAVTWRDCRRRSTIRRHWRGRPPSRSSSSRS